MLFLYYLFLPFLWALAPAAGIDLSLGRVLVPLFFLGWLGRGLLTRKLFFGEPLWQSLFFAWFGWAMLSATWSWEASWAFRKALFLLNFFLLIPVLLALSREARHQILIGFIYGAWGAALIGIGQFLGQFLFGLERVFRFWVETLLPFFLGPSFAAAVATYPSLLVNIGGATYVRASAFFPDPHLYALYLGMALPLALALYLREPRRVPGLVPALILAGNLLAFSRGGYVALLLSGFAGLALLSFSASHRRKAGWGLALFLFLVGLSFLSPVGSRFFSSFSAEDGSNQERLRLLFQAVEHIKLAPVIGQGLGNYPLLVKPEASSREPIYAHNLYLDTWLELGLIGLSLLLGSLGWALWRGIKGWFHNRDLLLLGGVAALINFLTHSLFEAPLFSVHLLPALLLCLVWIINPPSSS